MELSNEIVNYNDKLATDIQWLANKFCETISKTVPLAQGKVWHGHPVWFVDGNPIAGYSLKKSGLEVLFWIGQSFKTSGLKPIGKFKAAGFLLNSQDDLDDLDVWLKEAITIQWDYANLPKKRSLEKLTSF